MNRLDATISVFQGVKDTAVIEHISLRTMLERIQDGTYADAIAEVRAIKATADEETYTAAKRRLVSFTPCCDLTSRAEKLPWPRKLRSTTGLAHFDLDHLDAPDALLAKLRTDPALAFAFRGPGNDGLKIDMAAQGIRDVASYTYCILLFYPCLRHVTSCCINRFQRTPPCWHAIVRRRKDDPCVGPAARGIVA